MAVIFEGQVTEEDVFTVTVAVIAVPVQLFATGVMVNVTVIDAPVLFTSVPLISPEPVAGIPVTPTVLSLVQLYTVPGTAPLITIEVIGVPEQTVCEAGVATAFGMGFIVPVTGWFCVVAPVELCVMFPDGLPATPAAILT